VTTIAVDLEQRIADDILSGRIAPGAKLDEQMLAERFNVSRTPVREALRQLLGTGLVESIPRRGAVVTSFGPERLSQLYETIGELETLCARLAAQRMTAIERKELELALVPLLALGAGDADGAGGGWLAAAKAFGVMSVDEYQRIVGFNEKPEQPTPMPGNPERALASMGIYVFNAKFLYEQLIRDADDPHSTHDFGHDIIPHLVNRYRVFAHRFSESCVGSPVGTNPYWRDVGTLDTYFAAHLDVLGMEPRFDAFNPQWPIYSSHYQGPTARVVRGHLDNVLLGAATIISGATIKNSLLRREVVVEPGAEIEDCVIMDYARIGAGAKLRHAIIDRHNVIAPGAQIGYDLERDRAAGYHITEGGLVVVPLGDVRYFSREERRMGGGYSE